MGVNRLNPVQKATYLKKQKSKVGKIKNENLSDKRINYEVLG